MRVVLAWFCLLFVTVGMLGCGGRPDPADSPEFRDTAADPSLLQSPSATPPGKPPDPARP